MRGLCSRLAGMKIFVQEIMEDFNWDENLDIVERNIYDAKIDFVHRQIEPLDDEMIIEENKDDIDSCYILLKMKAPLNQLVVPVGYSLPLQQKILELFSSSILQELEARIRGYQGNLN